MPKSFGSIEKNEMNTVLQAVKPHLPQLKELLAEVSDHWGYEDGVYRFYHHSFKVYTLQQTTLWIVKDLQAVMPNRPLNKDFMKIVEDGTGKKWEESHYKKWLRHTRPIAEAFFHARHMLEMVCKYGEELQTAPRPMPSGWATVLCLYNVWDAIVSACVAARTRDARANLIHQPTKGEKEK